MYKFEQYGTYWSQWGYYLGEFARFIRLETCLFISGIAITGYLIFGFPGNLLSWVFSSVFFLSAFSYAYNHLTDKEEDLINNKRLNVFVGNGIGPPIAIVLVLLTLLSTLPLPATPSFFVFFAVTMSIIYSGCGVKRTFLFKNIFTGFTIALMFLVGATAAQPSNAEMILLSLLVLLFGFVLNVCGDIRGYNEDLVSGVKTIPVIYGIRWAKATVYFSLAFFTIAVLLFGIKSFYFLILSAFLISFFLWKNDPKKTRYSILSSFSILPLLMILLY